MIAENFAFRFFETRQLYAAGEAVTQTRVWKAQNQSIELGFDEDIWLTIPRGRFDDVQSSINIPNIVLAPLAAGQPVAELKLELDGEELMNIPLRALADNPSGSLWQRTKDSVMLWFE